MYVCGPTVYDQIHIGNARTFLAFDVIRRYLIHKGYVVTFAQNLTDVDDKIIKRAQDEGKDAAEVAQVFADAFIEQMERLGVMPPDIRPRATEEIDQMIKMIQGLIEKGHAYAADNGDVYFSVRSCETYGSVSGRNVDELLVGARIKENEGKKDPLDFALWKAAKEGEPFWKSPWGQGRPGWHTECSAMVHTYLGTPIDIHGGGADLIFPHHENEAAQASGCWDEPLANVWMHTGMLRVDGEKMSKSQGNFFTLKEVLDAYPADAVRLLMLQTHYRSSMDFSFERLRGAVGRLGKLFSTLQNLDWIAAHSFDTSDAEKIPGQSAFMGETKDQSPKLTTSSQSSIVRLSGEGKDGERKAADQLFGKGLSGAGKGGEQDLSVSCLEQDSPLMGDAKEATKAFEEAMDDDFNSASALAAIFALQNKANKWLETADPGRPETKEEATVVSYVLQELLAIFGIGTKTLGKAKKETINKSEDEIEGGEKIKHQTPEDHEQSKKAACLAEIAKKYLPRSKELNEGLGEKLGKVMNALVEVRDQARKTKDFATADAIRDELTAAGFTVEDTAQGTRIKE